MVDYEIAVIGGGIVGCAVFDKLVLNGIKTVLIEKGEDVSLGATRANSGIVHAGYDCVPKTLKALLNVKGNLMYEKMAKRLGEKITKCGSLVVCKKEDLSGLEELRDRGILNGINNLRIIENEELKKMEECINVPIILVTGRRDKETILNSGIMGVDGFLAKPVSKQTLVGKVNEIYQKKKSKENRKTVLMIDDDMNYLKQVNTMLQDNYNVVIINSAKLALSYLTKHIPDVILMDYQMPLYNGASLMNIIQKNTRGIKVPVIVLSGALNREILQECYQYNPAAILAKPASRKDLIKNIEDALKQ